MAVCLLQSAIKTAGLQFVDQATATESAMKTVKDRQQNCHLVTVCVHKKVWFKLLSLAVLMVLFKTKFLQESPSDTVNCESALTILYSLQIVDKCKINIIYRVTTKISNTCTV